MACGRSRPIAQIADALTEEVTRDGFIVERALLESGSPRPPPADYGAVVIGAAALARRVADEVPPPELQ